MEHHGLRWLDLYLHPALPGRIDYGAELVAEPVSEKLEGELECLIVLHVHCWLACQLIHVMFVRLVLQKRA